MPTDKRLLLMGGGDTLRAVVNYAVSLEMGRHEFGVLYDPEMEAEGGTFEASAVADLCKQADIACLSNADHDSREVAAWIGEQGFNLAIICSWRRIISGVFLGLFEGNVINIHNGDLPRHRGAGGLTWQVLQGERDAAIAVHVMSPTLDTGPVLFIKKQRLPEGPVYPATVMKTCHQLMVDEAIPQLFQALEKPGTLAVQSQDSESACYFPMLFTPRNGLLDLSWEASATVTFIRAFSYPYPGATVRYGDQVVRIKEASVRTRDADVHPYLQGLIANVCDAGIDVFVGGGVVRFELLVDDSGRPLPVDHFRAGNRFYNRAADLLDARLYRHRHTRS